MGGLAGSVGFARDLDPVDDGPRPEAAQDGESEEERRRQESNHEQHDLEGAFQRAAAVERAGAGDENVEHEAAEPGRLGGLGVLPEDGRRNRREGERRDLVGRNGAGGGVGFPADRLKVGNGGGVAAGGAGRVLARLCRDDGGAAGAADAQDENPPSFPGGEREAWVLALRYSTLGGVPALRALDTFETVNYQASQCAVGEGAEHSPLFRPGLVYAGSQKPHEVVV